MGSWIKLSEELPPRGAKPVLVSDGTHVAVGRYYRRGRKWTRGWSLLSYEMEGADVTHWMGIPSTPGGG